MMRISFLFLATMAIVMSCSDRVVRIVVGNDLGFERVGELVVVEDTAMAVDFEALDYVLVDGHGDEVPYTIIGREGGRAMAFQADVPAMGEVVYILKEGKHAEVSPKVDARFVPERKDDFSWENNLAAYRMYGPALAAENPSNGVDLWLKCTDEPVTAGFYEDDLRHNVSYHENHGRGLDCYDVKHTAGAGGIVPYSEGIWVGNHFDGYEIVEVSPLRAVFRLFYDSVVVGGKVFRESITITCDAGGLLNRADVVYDGTADGFSMLAAAITLHNGGGVLFSSPVGVAGYAEDAVSSSGVRHGRSYVGVYMPGAKDIRVEENHYIAAADYTMGQRLTYYFGGGWSEWKFRDDDSWFDALVRFADCVEHPLRITVK